ncbi:MAG TPA: hypothetical protein VM264_08680 [Acidimicrobiales bacterium]|nr:hypothetical protein [Acidimicrobiales bacterium]
MEGSQRSEAEVPGKSKVEHHGVGLPDSGGDDRLGGGADLGDHAVPAPAKEDVDGAAGGGVVHAQQSTQRLDRHHRRVWDP